MTSRDLGPPFPFFPVYVNFYLVTLFNLFFGLPLDDLLKQNVLLNRYAMDHRQDTLGTLVIFSVRHTVF